VSQIAQVVAEERQRAAEQIRAAMPPEMLAVCEAVKVRFPGMRLLYLRTDALTVGRDVVDEAKEAG
jgi:hypothetical protein